LSLLLRDWIAARVSHAPGLDFSQEIPRREPSFLVLFKNFDASREIRSVFCIARIGATENLEELFLHRAKRMSGFFCANR
jgi:hypothetical protein